MTIISEAGVVPPITKHGREAPIHVRADGDSLSFPHDTWSFLKSEGTNNGQVISQHQTSRPWALFAYSIMRNSRKNLIGSHGHHFLSGPCGCWNYSIIPSLNHKRYWPVA